MKTVAIFSTTRGDISILSPLIKEIQRQKNLNYLFFIGGTHLKKDYGNTINEIKKIKIKVRDKFNYIIKGDSCKNILSSLSDCHEVVSKIFEKYKFDIVCILGDRFEKLAIVNNSIIYKKPLIHLHGGEITEGVIDNQIRQMISKAAHLHFVICEQYKQNLIFIGENVKRIFNYGSLAVDTIKNIKEISKSKLFKFLNLNENIPVILLTYHPTTLENKISNKKQIKNIFDSLKNKKFQIIVTSPGHEVGRLEIENYIRKFTIKNKKIIYIKSLGHKLLFNLLPHCEFMIGNSSAGIIEAPFFRIPTINIGDRQKGRYMHKSIINSNYSVSSIAQAIRKACSNSFKIKVKKVNYIFGSGNAAKKIVKKINNLKINQKLLRKK